MLVHILKLFLKFIILCGCVGVRACVCTHTLAKRSVGNFGKSVLSFHMGFREELQVVRFAQYISCCWGKTIIKNNLGKREFLLPYSPSRGGGGG